VVDHNQPQATRYFPIEGEREGRLLQKNAFRNITEDLEITRIKKFVVFCKQVTSELVSTIGA
jgi:hypothetical protein